MKPHIISLLAVAVLSAAITPSAFAEEGGKARGQGRHGVAGGHEIRGGEHRGARGWGGERDIRHFENRHLHVWRSGVWHHSRHDGRLGWWWVVAGTWYFYPGPIYPYPDPYIPPYVVVQQTPGTVTPATQPPAQYWYYCEASNNYYPYVSTCPAGWKAVPATPPGTSAPPAR